jgi:putative N6-adenine-specific DNA methylase
MSAWEQPGRLVLSCARGLAPFAACEAEALGCTVAAAAETSVTLSGTLRDALRLNLWLRTAHRVLWPLAEGPARTLDDLYALARAQPWEDWIDPDGYFTVGASGRQPGVRDSRLPSLRVKDAVADRLRAACGRRPDSGPESRGVSLAVHWADGRAALCLDTTGEPLARRGYRLHPWKAPLQETLAAACLLAAEWRGETPFVAPMCGSGTPAIEAAWIAARRAPGILRERFAFMALRGYDGPPAAGWQNLRAAARAGERLQGLPAIVASDIDPDAVRAARANAAAAGCADLIEFSVGDFAAIRVPPAPGLVFLNPEYGRRLGREEDLAALYGRIGDFLKQRCAGYQGYVITGSAGLAGRIGLRSARRWPLFNGPIPCRLLAFDLYEGSRRTQHDSPRLPSIPSTSVD